MRFAHIHGASRRPRILHVSDEARRAISCHEEDYPTSRRPVLDPLRDHEPDRGGPRQAHDLSASVLDCATRVLDAEKVHLFELEGNQIVRYTRDHASADAEPKVELLKETAGLLGWMIKETEPDQFTARPRTRARRPHAGPEPGRRNFQPRHHQRAARRQALDVRPADRHSPRRCHVSPRRRRAAYAARQPGRHRGRERARCTRSSRRKPSPTA